MLPSGNVLRASYKKLVIIDGLINEFKKYKLNFLFFNFHILSHLLTPKSIMLPCTIQKGWE